MTKVKLTRSGIAHDLKLSPYKVSVHYEEGDELIFVFSSKMYTEKFKEKIEDNRDKINESLSKRFGFMIHINKIADLKLYSMIETRGFLIVGKEDYLCPEDIILDGTTLM